MNLKPWGLHGCSCHPYEDWKECKREHQKVLKIGDPVKQRHTGEEGTVHKVYSRKEGHGYVLVKYGPLQRDIHQEHVANLILQQ